MLLTVVRVYQEGRKLSERELREAEGVVGDVRTHVVQINGKAVRQAICMGQTTANLPPLIEPQLAGISPLALGLEGYEEVKTPNGIVCYRQGWWCRMVQSHFRGMCFGSVAQPRILIQLLERRCYGDNVGRAAPGAREG